MKKYIKPISEAIKTENEQILAGSMGHTNDKVGFDGGIGGFAKKNEFLLDDENEDKD